MGKQRTAETISCCAAGGRFRVAASGSVCVLVGRCLHVRKHTRNVSDIASLAWQVGAREVAAFLRDPVSWTVAAPCVSSCWAADSGA